MEMSEPQQYLEKGLISARESSARPGPAVMTGRSAPCSSPWLRARLRQRMRFCRRITGTSHGCPNPIPKYDRLAAQSGPPRGHRTRPALCCRPAIRPWAKVLEDRRLENGLELSKVRVPMGVIAVIFESRPNVTFDVFALCLKTLNACVLKGSSDAHDTNRVVVETDARSAR